MKALSVHHEVLRLAWPLAIGMLSYTAMTVADSIFVGQLGTAPLAGVGLGATALHLLAALPHGLLGGARVHIARSVGAGDHASARAFAWQAAWIAGAGGLVLAAAAPFAHELLRTFGASPEVAGHGAGYLGARLLGGPILFAVLGLQVWFEGRGDTRRPMIAVLVANVVNIGLDPVLIHGLFGAPAMGAAGAGVATVIACVAQAALLVGFAASDLWPQRAWPDRALLRRIGHTGLPIGAHALLDVAAYALFAGVLAGVGEAHLAAHVIVIRVLMVSFLPGMAIAEAGSVLVGQALGAGRPAHAQRIWAAALVQAVGFMSALGVVFLVVPGPIVAAFGADPAVAAVAIDVLAIAAWVQVFDAASMVSVGALSGAGDTRFTTAAGLACAWLVKIPVSLFAVWVADLGAAGAWLGIAAELVVLSAVTVARVRGDAWHGTRASPSLDAVAAPIQ